MLDKDLYIQRILDNERLTRDLDDQGAKALLDWAIDIIKTTDFEDERQIREVERAMRRVSNLVGRKKENSFGENREALDEIIQAFHDIPGFDQFSIGEGEKRAFLVRTKLKSHQQGIQDLRKLFPLQSSQMQLDSRHKGGEPVKKRGQSIEKAQDRKRVKASSPLGALDPQAGRRKSSMEESDRDSENIQDRSRQRNHQQVHRTSRSGSGSGASFSARHEDDDEEISGTKRKDRNLGKTSDRSESKHRSRIQKQDEDDDDERLSRMR